MKGPSKICGGHLLKNFTWSILEYFAPYNINLLSDLYWEWLQIRHENPEKASL